ncbi:MAG: NAD(P)-dependent oxidoreductase [Ketobacteraceae bacterium]|nr:NAD(P)-dependent oxidoreductase [Ketobacteraceae bacterium]
MKIAFLGLGVMGYPMAGHLKKAGHDITVYNRTAAKSERWVSEHGGKAAATPSEATTDCDMVFMCVGDDNDLMQVATSETGALKGMAPGTVLVDHTTASAEAARNLDRLCQEQQCRFIDAPVSGGQQGAENGQLTIMCGGDDSAFEKARPVMDCYGKQVTLMGPAGHGQLTKMVNQITICGLIQSLSEGLNFAERAGLDPLKVIDVISKGAAQSWQMENRHKTMLADEYEHGFAVDWMRKDLKICLEEAERNGSSLPIAALIDQFYGDIQRMGGGRFDTSSLLFRLKSLEKC